MYMGGFGDLAWHNWRKSLTIGPTEKRLSEEGVAHVNSKRYICEMAKWLTKFCPLAKTIDGEGNVTADDHDEDGDDDNDLFNPPHPYPRDHHPVVVICLSWHTRSTLQALTSPV